VEDTVGLGTVCVPEKSLVGGGDSGSRHL
jgi:hypothetical protein